MTRSRILLLVALPVITAAIAGITFAAVGASNRSQGTSPWTGSVPVSSASDGNDALRAAGAKAGFPAKVPDFFATSANRLVLVDASTGPGGVSNGLRLIELLYESDRIVLARGQQTRVSAEIFLTNVRLTQPTGERQTQALAGYEIYSQVVDRDQAGAPLKVSFTALGNNETIVIDFTGEQPTQGDLARMLGSFRAVPSSP